MNSLGADICDIIRSYAMNDPYDLELVLNYRKWIIRELTKDELLIEEYTRVNNNNPFTKTIKEYDMMISKDVAPVFFSLFFDKEFKFQEYIYELSLTLGSYKEYWFDMEDPDEVYLKNIFLSLVSIIGKVYKFKTNQ